LKNNNSFQSNNNNSQLNYNYSSGDSCNDNNFYDIQNNNYQSDVNKEIVYLKNELNNKNKIIKQQKSIIEKLQNQLNILNNNFINENKINPKQNELILLKQELNNKNEEIKRLKLNYLGNNFSNSNNSNEFTLMITFTSFDQQIYCPISCGVNDTIVKLEEKLYNKYSKYKDYNTYLTNNGNIVKRFKTIQENGIENGNIIIVNIFGQ
jgi:hypothetical protein